jgi:adenylate cyclase
MPSKEEAERILSGLVSPSKRRTVSLIVFRLTNLGDAARAVRPQVLVGWLNAYFDCLCASAQRFGGYVDHFDARNTVVVFGSLDEESHANSSLLCVIDAVQTLRQLSTKLAERDAPGFVVAMGVHTGPVVSGEVGSVDRRHYTVVGDTVNVTNQISREAEDIADSAFPVLLSATTIRDAGLFARLLERSGLAETAVLTGGFEPLQLYAIMDPTLLKQALILEATRSI